MKKIRIFALLSTFLTLPLLAQPKPMMAAAQTNGVPGVLLTWTASLTPGTTVSIYRCVGTPCAATSSFTPLTTGVVAAGPYTDTTITAGVYSYYGVAVANGASAPASNIVSITVSPQPITGLSATATP